MGKSPYGHGYRKLRASLIGLPCELQLVCGKDGEPAAEADSADHTPPLSRHEHVEGSGCCRLRPACMACQGEQARLLSMETKERKRLGLTDDVVVHDETHFHSLEWL